MRSDLEGMGHEASATQHPDEAVAEELYLSRLETDLEYEKQRETSFWTLSRLSPKPLAGDFFRVNSVQLETFIRSRTPLPGKRRGPKKRHPETEFWLEIIASIQSGEWP